MINQIKKKYLAKKNDDNFLDYQKSFHHNLYQNAYNWPVAIIISLICFSNAIMSVMKTSSPLIFIAQLDLFLVYLLGNYFYKKQKFSSFNFLMKTFPYYLLVGWLTEVWVLYKFNHNLPSTISINTMILVFAVVSFHPSKLKSMFNFLCSLVLLFFGSSLLFSEFKFSTLTLFLDPIAVSAFLHVMVSTVLKYSFNNSAQNEILKNVFSKAKKQREFLKDLLEASVQLQKHETTDELILNITAKIANVFPSVKIGILLLCQRKKVLVSSFVNYSQEMKQEVLFTQENNSAKSLVYFTREVEGQIYTLKAFIEDPDFDQDDLDILSTFLDQMVEVIRIKILGVILERAAHLDPLTEAYNRTYLNKVLADFNKRLKNNTMSSPFSVIFCDVNGLKKINDIYGHSAGDHYIKEIAKNIKSCIRETDLFFRCGGDEFVILCPNLLSSSAHIIQERIETKVNSSYMILAKENKGFKEKMGVSIGLSDSSEDEDPVCLADKRMLSNKAEYYKENVKYR